MRDDDPTAPRPQPRSEGVSTFRASCGQERLWALEQIAPGSAVANVAGAVRALGRLDLAVLRRGLERLVARHESLRTTFVVVDGVLIQVVSPIGAVSFSVTDVDGSSIETRDAVARRAILVEVEAPFDVARGPLLRVHVFAIGSDRHLVAVSMHHLIADACSMTNFVRELLEAYAQGLGRDRECHPRPTLQFADFAIWERGMLRDDRATTAREYWRRQLDGVPPPPTLGGNGGAFRGMMGTRELAPGTVAALRTFVRSRGTTLFATALAIWQLVLARWRRSDDVVVLSPVANRDHPAVADVIGFFVNVVALRARWTGDPRFDELLASVQVAVRDALRHQSLPFGHVLDALGAARRLDRAPLSPFGFALERVDDEAIRLPGLVLSTLPLERVTSRTDLALVVSERSRSVVVRVEHDGGRVAAATASTLLDEFVELLGAVVTNPERRVSELSGGAELRREPSCVPVSPEETLWQAFDRQAGRTPTAIALRVGGDAITYADLRAGAGRVAGELRSQGRAPQSLVAVWGERGMHLASCLLGILRAGAVYLPIDPRWPAARVVQVLRESGASLVLAPSHVLPPEVRAGEWRIVVVGDLPEVAPDAGATTATATVAADDVAYALYTSGSTGKPKGAVITQAALMNHLRAKIALLGLGPADRVAQTAAAGFDISLWQYLAVWLVGGEVVVLEDAIVRDPEQLCAAVAASNVTVLQLVPAVLRLVLDVDAAARSASFRDLRWVIATGESLPPEICRAWLTRYPHVPIVNAYGPTECADDVAHHVLRVPPPPTSVRVPIGTPIDGVALHIVDDALRPVPSGQVGELCVSGVAVGRGYLNDPVRTAEVFTTLDATTRVYRTGDLGRVAPDGTYECLGRRDDQIKIRGVRVEPGEIEAVLQRHPRVRAAAVVPRRAPDGSLRLVACVIPAAMPVTLAEDLRRHLAERLPDAMVPAAFELRATLPLTVNGKIDRIALASATAVNTHRASEPDFTQENALLEGILADIWREVLATDVRSVDDDFFALGGDSLASIRVVAAARRHGFRITPRQMFEYRTIARIAAVADVLTVDPGEQGLVVGVVEPTPVQRMFLEADLEGIDHYNLTMLLEVDEPIVASSLAVAVEHLTRHHDMLRARWQRHDGVWRQTIGGLDGPVPFLHIDLADAGAAEASAAIEERADALQASLRLTDGPLLRIVLFDLGPSRPSRVLVIVHHLACDIASWPILLDDLARVYAQVQGGQPITLPAKTASFQAWARRLGAFAEGPDASDELAFWERECRDAGSRLPSCAADGPPSIGDGEFARMVLGPRETAAVVAAAADRSVTIEALLLTGLALAVTEEAGGEALLVFLERHGRHGLLPECDVSRTVGWFTAVFPCRVPVAASRSADTSLLMVEHHLRALPHGGVGYGVLRFAATAGTSATVRALAHPEISFNYLGRVDPPEGLGWRIAPEAPGREIGVRGSRPTTLDVTGHLANGRLHVSWAYDRVRHARGLITGIGDRMLEIVRGFGPAPSSTMTERAACR